MNIIRYHGKGIIDRKRLIDISKELFRKTIHMCSAFVPLFLGFMYWPVLIALICVLIFYIVAEILRVNGVNVPGISYITAAAARKRDEGKFVLGPVTMSLGVIVSSIIWPLQAATIGIFALSFGDGLASLSGKLFGRVQIPFTKGKTVAGSLTCFTAVFVSSFFVSRNSFVSLVNASAAMFIEVMPIKDFDNLIIPISIGGLSKLLLNL